MHSRIAFMLGLTYERCFLWCVLYGRIFIFNRRKICLLPSFSVFRIRMNCTYS